MASKRKSLSKKVRFDVFKRDGFACQYCGNTPPAVILEVDHIDPVCEGGEDTRDNLITACFDCNRGKAGATLSVAPDTVAQKAMLLAEKQEQLKAFRRLKVAEKRRLSRDVSTIEKVFQSYWEGHGFTDAFRQSIRVQFLPKMDVDTLVDNMHKACMRCPTADRATKYFCGTNWGMIKGKFQ